MANTNCLDGMECPECKSEGPFNIEAKSTFEVSDSGTGDHEDVVWSDDSYCGCIECGHSGTVKTFTKGT